MKIRRLGGKVVKARHEGSEREGRAAGLAFAMWAVVPTLTHAVMLLGLVAQDARAPTNQLSLEVVPLAGALGYARRAAPNTSFGVKLGFGFDMLSPVPLAGGHFTDDWGLSYEQRDGYNGKHFVEVAQVAVFIRHFLPRRFHLEVGVRLAGGMHSDSSDDDSAGADYTAGYGAVFWGGSILSVGSRVSVGMFSESRHGAPPERELAVVLNPIIVKLTTP
jgi:hypothetical protein